MIGFMPTPDGLGAPRSYGNPHNQSTPRTAGNRMGGNIGISRRPPNFMPQQPQQPQQIGYQGTPMQPQQPTIPVMQFLAQSQATQPIQPPYSMRRGAQNLNFGRQYHEQAVPLGAVGN